MLIQTAQFAVIRWGVSEILREAGHFREELQLCRTRIAEQIHEFLVVGLIGRMMKAEIIHVERERTIAVLPDQLPDLVNINGLAVGGHAHDLVFAFIYFKAQECGERAI